MTVSGTTARATDDSYLSTRDFDYGVHDEVRAAVQATASRNRHPYTAGGLLRPERDAPTQLCLRAGGKDRRIA